MNETLETALPTQIIWTARRHMPDVLDIDRRSFEQSWDDAAFLDQLRQRNVISMSAVHGDRIVGFVVYRLHRTFIEVVRMAVAPEHRRRGVGSAILDKLAGKLNPHRRTAMEFIVRESNLDACRFLRHNGVRAVEVLRGHFDDEDGYRMEYRLTTKCAAKRSLATTGGDV
jgi:[ribosomal protein S18]-alanine N-acetyltransferase